MKSNHAYISDFFGLLGAMFEHISDFFYKFMWKYDRVQCSRCKKINNGNMMVMTAGLICESCMDEEETAIYQRAVSNRVE